MKMCAGAVLQLGADNAAESGLQVGWPLEKCGTFITGIMITFCFLDCSDATFSNHWWTFTLVSPFNRCAIPLSVIAF